MTTRPYDNLPHAAQQRISQGLHAMLECKQRELKLLQQTLVITRAVTAHPESPEKWPLPAPWPEGFVIRRADGQFARADMTAYAQVKKPRGWTALLSEAYIWHDFERAEMMSHGFFGLDRQVITVADACTQVAA
jgi:hypothetical protein